MKKEGFYSSGEFAKKAHVTKKTIRYYDEHNILKPSFVSDSGARFYSDEDFARLQQILFLKYLGFSLADIKEMTVRNSDKHFLRVTSYAAWSYRGKNRTDAAYKDGIS